MKRKYLFFILLLWAILPAFAALSYGQGEHPGGEDPFGGGSGPSCSDPPPSDPGNDHPDETFAVDSGNPPFEPFFTSDPHAVVLTNGKFRDTINLLSRVKKGYASADVRTSGLDFIASSTVLIIPSGGLYGLGKSAFFRGALEEFLKQGGTLVVFAQQHGYDFSVLPVPEEPDGTFNRVGGYGWTEDQACFTNSAYIDTWHQILSGQNRATPTLNVDGYFTLYPSTSTVLLRRTQNHQPVMLLYEYGPGRVIVSSLYSDYAFGRSQASSEEIALIRDVVTWAKAPAELSETEPGGTVTVQVTVKNFAAKDAASVKFYVYPPNRDEVLGSQAATVAVPAGQSATIPVTAPSSSALGIYHIDYELIDSNGDVIQPEAETDSGRFVASNPPDDAYQPSSSFKVWVTTTTDRVTEGSDVTFTIHIKNNTSSDLVDGQIGIGSHEAGGKHWIYRETITGVNINAGQTAEVAWTFRIDLSQAVYFGLFRADQNADSYFLKGGLARAERGVRILRPSVAVSVQPNKPLYGRGDTVNLALTLENPQTVSFLTALKVKVFDPLNQIAYQSDLSILLPPLGDSSRNVDFVLSDTAEPGVYVVSAEAYDEQERKIGNDSVSFVLPRLDLAVSPVLPAAFSTSNTISFLVENRGDFPVSSATVAGSLKDPEGSEIWSGQASVSSLQPDQMATVDFSVPITNLTFGTYTLIYSISYDGITKASETSIPNTPVLAITLDKPSYRAREVANLTLTVTHSEEFVLDPVTVSLSAPDMGYWDSKAVSLTSQTTAFSY